MPKSQPPKHAPHAVRAGPVPQRRRAAAHICAGTGLTPATFAPGLGSLLIHLHWDLAHPAHICTETGLIPPTAHLHRGWAHRWPHLHKGSDRLRQVSLLDAAGSVVSLPWHPTVTGRRVVASCCVASLHRCSHYAMLCGPFVVTSRLSRRRFRNGVFPLRQRVRRAAPCRAYRRQSTLSASPVPLAAHMRSGGPVPRHRSIPA